MQSLATIQIALLCMLAFMIISYLLDLNLLGMFKFVVTKVFQFLFRHSAKFINKSEARYHRDYEVGKINEKKTKVKLYKFLNELVIDLEIREYGITPYELLFLVTVMTFLVQLVFCLAVFSSWLMVVPIFPMLEVGVFCVLYTKANVAHDARIEAVYEAENIICNNIQLGVVPAVRSAINMMPKEIRDEFVEFLDNVESKNYHIKTALQALNTQLGSVQDDFIKKCIVYETEEEHGVAGVFKDVVEVNNIKMEMRIEMKRQFEKVVSGFLISACMIFIFIAGVLVIYPNVREFYFTNPLGQLLIAIDLLLMIIEYVFITWLRAREL